MKGECPFAERIQGVTSFSPAQLVPVGFCDHAAGGFLSTMRNASFWNNAGVSVHFAIGRDGSIIQIVNLFQQAWAQGRIPDDSKVSWPPYNTMGLRNPNTYLVSAEHEDWYLDSAGQAHAVPNSEWTPAEYNADLKLKRWVVQECATYGIDVMRFGIDSLAGHHMFDPRDRANCPGQFWRNQYQQRLFADLTNPQQEAGDLANLNGDGSQRIVSDGNFIVIWNNNVPVIRYGSTDGQYPGRISKNFAGMYLWFRTLDDQGNLVTPYWSQVEGD